MDNNVINLNLEIPAVIFGLLNVYLAARGSILNWLFGVLTVSLYVVIFLHAKLYANVGLQCIFLMMQFYGYYSWQRTDAEHHYLKIKKADKTHLFFASIIAILLFAILSFLLQRYTDSTTIYLDAFTAALSLVAQWMLSQKWLENWLLWIIVDVVAINMYLVKHLYLTSLLYGLFFAISLMGYITWQRNYRKSISVN